MGLRRSNSGQLVVGGERRKLDRNVWNCRLIGRKALAQSIEVRQSAGVEIGVDRLRQFGFTGTVMRERQQADHDAAGLLLAFSRQQRLESALAKLDKYHLLVLDDIVYVSKDQAETSALFELIGSRYERRAMLITANQPFGEWAKFFLIKL